MELLWVQREIDAPAGVMWELLSDPEQWPTWGLSVKRAQLDAGEMRLGASGTVTTAVGIPLRFEITSFEPGRYWAWKVAKAGATHHRVEAMGPARCRVGFGVPWVAAPYLAVCGFAPAQLDALGAAKVIST